MWFSHPTYPTPSSFSNPSGDRRPVSQLPSTRSSFPHPSSTHRTSKEDDRKTFLQPCPFKLESLKFKACPIVFNFNIQESWKGGEAGRMCSSS
ncbi:hypothetical protein C343_05442 [Cryptococcus neoformans C23]|uniref:Uncharacterized protein n=2 Tax=Cryptococcus neoformans TaxID=5207 RepID=A0A854QDX7_CRYNE|nr:hypothetical protein CNAG_07840 [Cryptococcus neoformans var. grubii H99]AUB27305.1 hypothetical protein CKF44_07840 [Cryptococcus neoformans var. grubii]OWZ28593.1 hypothetical protein C347_05479 [Cryptococcus neoformans var. grubii AD2-60a]OWZ35006.1 hypothetical protein C353_05336 [Cryptococcus neoformans var. grubii AD1-83a]OWZ40632.1 hypothetical protein C343_05442 [Cryptococcus neoformans var. grubii C23]OWZ51582.1 hypothetical protein C368_05602 [Cryptococcus neoformans var. grubii 1|eukprot:XP_012052311.1 hypothetical protein CNAG_07840 [Cryptococcus neoformans var. grubii H99]